ncbi:glycosyltransferase family 2 protein [Actinomyces sp.]|uniref:glycosyltransferase family 2 protein n=1 Tax=Actinomyces sp. TaxID=29317 RepID=UPI0026DD4C4B|nr:glycosyltransferase [Actinomyces sp.]MDO4899619.1 glycosyltransferase [Actinomyces sp.]
MNLMAYYGHDGDLSGLAACLDLVGSTAALVMVAVALTYLLALACAAYTLAGRRNRGRGRSLQPHTPMTGPMQIVILMPCLNEEAVIGPSVERLLAEPDPGLFILVIDDGSDDATSEIVRAIGDPRVGLLRREPPNARKGKGEALNHAVGIVRRRYRDADPERVIVGVVDADGHLDPSAWSIVRRAFRADAVGAVQLGVRISNRHDSLLARMQDIEFVTFTSIFQQARRRLGSVGMGGNAQFVRLAALDALGNDPWTRSLTEDFDLGIRLNATRWANEYRGEAAVHQEGVTSLRRLVRQRTRWFQGNLQARGLLGFIAQRLRGSARADTLWQVLSPYLLIVGSLLTVSFALMLCLCLDNVLHGVPQSWSWVPVAYLLAFGPSYLYAFVYWRYVRKEGTGPLRCIAWCHVFVAYGLLSGVYGWRALVREMLGRSGWAKTAREAARAPGALLPGASLGEGRP